MGSHSNNNGSYRNSDHYEQNARDSLHAAPRITSSRTRPMTSSSYSRYANVNSRYSNSSVKRDSNHYSQNIEEDYRQRAEIQSRESNRSIHLIVVILVSIIYWPLAIYGVVDPFLPGFTFGSLALWQVLIVRILISFLLGGTCYAFAVNLFHIRDARFFEKNKVIKIAAAIIVAAALTFVISRVICML